MHTGFSPSDAAPDLTQPENSPSLNSTERSQHARWGASLALAPGSFQAAKCRVIDQLPQGPPVSRWGRLSRHPSSRDIQGLRKSGLTGFPLQCVKALRSQPLGSTGYLPTRRPEWPSTAASCIETWYHPLHTLPVTRHHREPLENQTSGVCQGGADALNSILWVRKLKWFGRVQSAMSMTRKNVVWPWTCHRFLVRGSFLRV